MSPRVFALALLVLVGFGCASLGGNQQSQAFRLKKGMVAQWMAQKNWSAAFGAVRELLQEEPEDPELLTARGIIYREQGLPKEAEEDLLEALEREDELFAAHEALAVLYDSVGRPQEAAPHHERAVELRPNDANLLNNLGFSFYLRGKTRQAIETYQAALRLDPINKRIRNNLGFAYARLGDLTRAFEQFDKGGTPAQAQNNLGYAYERRGNLGQAYECYKKAVELDPTLEAARTNLEAIAPKINRPARQTGPQ